MESIVVVCLICAVLGYLIGTPKGKGGLGAVLGGLLGFLGLIIIAVMKPAAQPSGGPSPPVR